MRIAIVNDAPLAVEALRRTLQDMREHQVAWVAMDGVEAVKRCADDTPDLILMDLIMPQMDGVEATRRIMALNPCAILVVTANVDGNSAKVFEAMGAGAIDATNTPVLGWSGSTQGANVLRGKINTIGKIVTSSKPSTLLGYDAPPAHDTNRRETLIAIGASAGGPSALSKILSQLPANFPAPVVVVQHVDTEFASGLAHWLDYQTTLQVRLACAGDRPTPGTVLLAGKEDHLVFITPHRLSYTSHPMENPFKPSIDVFFKSACQHWQGDVIGVLLTGMGRDGAEGLRALHDAGYRTIVQDQASSVVYGMPKAATELKAASETLPIDKIGLRLRHLLSHKHILSRMADS